MLEGLPDECVGAVAARLVYLVFADGDVIYERRERADRMFFVISGTVTLRWAHAGADAADLRATPTPSHGSESSDGTCPSSATAEAAAARWATRTVEPLETLGELALRGLAEQALLGTTGEDHPPAPPRGETAVAEGRVCAQSLLAEDAKALLEDYPALARRLRDLCIVRETEARAMAATRTVAAGGSGWSSSWKADAEAEEKEARWFRTYLSRQRANLLRRQEVRLLEPAAVAASGASGEPAAIVRLLLRVHSGGASTWNDPVAAVAGVAVAQAEWRGISLLVTERRELLCFEHTDASMAGSTPRSLGFIVPGRSELRQLGWTQSAGRLVRAKRIGRASRASAALGGEDNLTTGLLVFRAPGPVLAVALLRRSHDAEGTEAEEEVASGLGQWLVLRARSPRQLQVLKAVINEALGDTASFRRPCSNTDAASKTRGIAFSDAGVSPLEAESGLARTSGSYGRKMQLEGGVQDCAEVCVSTEDPLEPYIASLPQLFVRFPTPPLPPPPRAAAKAADLSPAEAAGDGDCSVDDGARLQLDLLWAEHGRLRDQLAAAAALLASADRRRQP